MKKTVLLALVLVAAGCKDTIRSVLFSCESLSAETTLEDLLSCAEQGDARAQYALGFMYDNGEALVENDEAAAAHWYWLAAEQGDAYASYTLGTKYLDGDGVDQDTFEALGLLESAVALRPNEIGFGHPATSLGWIYLTGKYPGISRNTEEALRWNFLGARLGHTNALSNLAMMYAEGIGVERDYSIMLNYLIRSAEVFDDSFSWVLERPDEWEEYVTSAPRRFLEAREVYIRAIQTGDESHLNELKSLR